MAAHKITARDRKQIQALHDAFEEAREAYLERVTELRDELQEEYDNKSEKWQESENAETAMGLIENMGECVDTLENCADIDTSFLSES